MPLSRITSPFQSATANVYSPSANTVNIRTASTDRLSVTPTGNTSIDTNTLFVDAVNDNIGVGISNPSFKLDVLGGNGLQVKRTSGTTIANFWNTGTTSPNITIQGSDSTFSPFIGARTNALTFGTRNTERGCFSEYGNFLTGTATPAINESLTNQPGGIQAGDGFVWKSWRKGGGSTTVVTFNADFNYFLELTATAWGNGSVSIYQHKWIAGRRDWTGSPHAFNSADVIGTNCDSSTSFVDNSPGTHYRSYTVTFSLNNDAANLHWSLEAKYWGTVYSLTVT